MDRERSRNVQRSDQESLGLSREKAADILATIGPNRLPEPPVPGVLSLFIRQFLSPFIYILAIAAVVAFALGEIPSGVFIVVVLVLNAAIGTFQEFSATRAAAALRSLVKGTATVVRDGVAQTVDVEEVVPGDLVLLSSGDKVPADMRLIDGRDIAVDESMLTGESLAVIKDPGTVVADDAPLGDRLNAVFAGTILTRGRARGLVTATALNTELGKIAGRVTDPRDSEPPLMIRIRQFTYKVAAIIGIAIVLLMAIMAIHGGYAFEAMVLVAIGLAVSAIPEGLPAALTVTLAVGMRRMAEQNVIIRKLLAVEALGSCTYICSDKTGTLTVNELTVRKVVFPDGGRFDVSGEGIAPGGSVAGDGDRAQLQDLSLAGLLANESALDYAGAEWEATGDIVDAALLVLAKKVGLSLSTERATRENQALIPYESERAFAGSLDTLDGVTILHLKGSPERIIGYCSQMVHTGKIVPIDVEGLVGQAEALARDGYRVLALARKRTDRADDFDGMTFIGLVGMIDPIRPEAKRAVDRCRAGGIEVAMVTGDHPVTARAIALELGLCTPNDPVVTGTMLRQATAGNGPAIDTLVRSSHVFARIEPQQKEQIVKALMRAGHFVAVTGDGVNDAPAMRAANAGVAMGKRGTDVARESADLIITDDNFASIVNGIEQGRVVYNNIRKVVSMLSATGFSALLLFFMSTLAGLPMPLTAVQLLWLNLVAQGVQDVALAFEPKEGNELALTPRSPKEPIFEKTIIAHVLVVGTVMGVVAFAVYQWLLDAGRPVDEARNLLLMLMVIFANLHTLGSRSELRSIFVIPLSVNPFLLIAVPLAQAVHIVAMYLPGLGDVLGLQPISITEWASLLFVALMLPLTDEIVKVFQRRRVARRIAQKHQAAID